MARPSLNKDELLSVRSVLDFIGDYFRAVHILGYMSEFSGNQNLSSPVISTWGKRSVPAAEHRKGLSEIIQFLSLFANINLPVDVSRWIHRKLWIRPDFDTIPEKEDNYTLFSNGELAVSGSNYSVANNDGVLPQTSHLELTPRRIHFLLEHIKDPGRELFKPSRDLSIFAVGDYSSGKSSLIDLLLSNGKIIRSSAIHSSNAPRKISLENLAIIEVPYTDGSPGSSEPLVDVVKGLLRSKSTSTVVLNPVSTRLTFGCEQTVKLLSQLGSKISIVLNKTEVATSDPIRRITHQFEKKYPDRTILSMSLSTPEGDAFKKLQIATGITEGHRVAINEHSIKIKEILAKRIDKEIIGERLIAALAEILNKGIEEIKLESLLKRDLGADDIDLAEVMVTLRQEFEIEISDTRLQEFESNDISVSKLVDLILKLAPKPETSRNSG